MPKSVRSVIIFIYDNFMICSTVTKGLPTSIKHKMRARKTLFLLLAIFFSAMVLLAGAALYIYTHPPLVKEIVKKAVSSATGASFSVQHLSYSLNPINIRAQGIVVEPLDETNEFSAEIQDISVDCVLEGPLGRKTLVVSALKVKGLKGRMQEKATSVSKGSGSGGGSFLSSLARSFVSFFFFRDVKLADAEIEEGVVTVTLDGRKITVSGLSGDLNADHLLAFQGRILVESPKEQATFLLSDFHVNTTSTLSFAESPHQIHFGLLRWRTHQSPGGNQKCSRKSIDQL